jgi:hypothetical protein
MNQRFHGQEEFLMDGLPVFKAEIAERLGKRLLRSYYGYCGRVEEHIERNGTVIQEERRVFTPGEWMAYLLDRRELFIRLREEGHSAYKDQPLEEVMLEYLCPRYDLPQVMMLGEILTFTTGDFSHLYRFLALCARLEYACDIHMELLRGRGYCKGSGTDHSTYRGGVSACFALLRPDWAKCFFPKALGPVRECHPFSKILGNLVIGLLHDEIAWKKEAFAAARRFLEGKRQISERAAVSCLCNLYEGDVQGMSEDLATLMANYRKTPWLMVPGGEVNAVSLHGLYMMGKLYLEPAAFARLKRPDGPGWWDAFCEVSLDDVRRPELCEPPFSFPEPLSCFNEAIRWIEQGPPPDAIRLDKNIRRYAR